MAFAERYLTSLRTASRRWSLTVAAVFFGATCLALFVLLHRPTSLSERLASWDEHHSTAHENAAVNAPYVSLVDVFYDFRRHQFASLSAKQLIAVGNQAGVTVVQHLIATIEECSDARAVVGRLLAVGAHHPALVVPRLRVHCSDHASTFGKRVFAALDSLDEAAQSARWSRAATSYVVLLALRYRPPNARTFVDWIAQLRDHRVPALGCTAVTVGSSALGDGGPASVAYVADAGYTFGDGEAYWSAAPYLVSRDRGAAVRLGDTRSPQAAVQEVTALSGHCVIVRLPALAMLTRSTSLHSASALHAQCRARCEEIRPKFTAFQDSIYRTDIETAQLDTGDYQPAYSRRFTKIFYLLQLKCDPSHTGVTSNDVAVSNSRVGRFPYNQTHPWSYFRALLHLTNRATDLLISCHGLPRRLGDLTLLGWDLSSRMRTATADKPSYSDKILVSSSVRFEIDGEPRHELAIGDVNGRTSEGRQRSAIADAHLIQPRYPFASAYFPGLVLPNFAREPAHLVSGSGDAASSRIVIVWDAMCCYCCGFASEMLSFIIPLSQRMAVRTTISPDCFCKGLPRTVTEALDRLVLSPESYVAIPATDVVIWISHRQPHDYTDNSMYRLRTPDYFIGRSMYEFTKIPSRWTPRMNEVNEVWVPNSWVASVFETNGVAKSKLVEIPELIDTDLYDPLSTSHMRIPGELEGKHFICLERGEVVSTLSPLSSGSQRFFFLSQFKWEPRKGWSFLLDAYKRAFENSTHNVALIIVSTLFDDPDPRNERKLIDIVRSHYRRTLGTDGLIATPPICVLTNHLAEVDLVRLYGSVNAFVVATRGEGWGLPMMQAMAMAKPVIAPNWGGQTAFMTGDNSFLTDVDGEEEGDEFNNPYGFEKGKRWAVPSVANLAFVMRYIVENTAHATSVGRRARSAIVSLYSVKPVIDIIFNRLAVIGAFIWAQRPRTPPSSRL